jgi:hypothetical protein
MALYSVWNVNVKAETTYAFPPWQSTRSVFPRPVSSQLVIVDPRNMLCLWVGWQVLPSIQLSYIRILLQTQPPIVTRRCCRIDFPSRGRRKRACDTGVSLTCVWVTQAVFRDPVTARNRRGKAAGSNGVIAALDIRRLLFVVLGPIVVTTCRIVPCNSLLSGEKEIYTRSSPSFLFQTRPALVTLHLFPAWM